MNVFYIDSIYTDAHTLVSNMKTLYLNPWAYQGFGKVSTFLTKQMTSLLPRRLEMMQNVNSRWASDSKKYDSCIDPYLPKDISLVAAKPQLVKKPRPDSLFFCFPMISFFCTNMEDLSSIQWHWGYCQPRLGGREHQKWLLRPIQVTQTKYKIATFKPSKDVYMKCASNM